MKASDLMIGDWVRINSDINSDDVYWMHDNMHPGQALKVEEILSNGINPDWYCGEINDYIPEDALMPIPLTPEILEKNFEKKVNYGIFDDYYDFEIREYSDSVYVVNYRSCEFSLPTTQIVGICYVHELQHIFHLLGIEKEIEL